MKKISSNQEKSVMELYTSGKSGPIIADSLNLSLSQVYDALGRKGVARRTSVEQLNMAPLSFNFRKNLSSMEKQLQVAALMLYWGEGAKTGKTVDFANSNPRAIKLFLTFLRNICRIDENKLRIYLYCFSDQNLDELMLFWSRLLNIPISQFTRPYIRQSTNPGDRIMEHGVVHIRYNDKRLLEKILFLCSSTLDKLLQFGQVPKWPNGADCQKAAFEGDLKVNFPG